MVKSLVLIPNLYIFLGLVFHRLVCSPHFQKRRLQRRDENEDSGAQPGSGSEAVSVRAQAHRCSRVPYCAETCFSDGAVKWKDSGEMVR